MLAGKNILVALTGSIAAYKAAILVRLLVKEGAQVRVIMTPLAKEFITPLTMATVSRNPILVEFFDPENGAWNSHVSLGEWADLMLVAPATANTMAKMAHGVADNLLLTTYLSARCPVFVAPAMDLDMYAHQATQSNLRRLTEHGCRVVEPGSGELASGLEGKGRMAEPEEIVTQVRAFFAVESIPQSLQNLRFLVTAGPTIEPIDPVRYISNYSSGKMGYALAAELKKRGAQVVLVSGKTDLVVPEGVELVRVTTAQQMYEACVEHFPGCHGAVMCAAVADYTPQSVAPMKIKKGGEAWSIELQPTRDIAAELGRVKGTRLLVGFALETDHERENAQAKLKKKNLDLIILNSLAEAGAGFGVDTNRITILDSRGGEKSFPLKSKVDVAVDIVDVIAGCFVAPSKG